MNFSQFTLLVLEHVFEGLLLLLQTDKGGPERLAFVVEFSHLGDPLFALLGQLFALGLDLVFELIFHFDCAFGEFNVVLEFLNSFLIFEEFGLVGLELFFELGQFVLVLF